MRIGTTEYGDAGLDLRWKEKLNSSKNKKPWNGALLITKNITDKFIESVLSETHPLVIHCTCTGYGGSIIEPNVPDYKQQLDKLKKLIEAGFNPENIVLRVDPIIPKDEYLAKTKEMLDYFFSLNLGITRFRMSVLDEYPFIKGRLNRAGIGQFYKGENFYASDEEFDKVAKLLCSYPAVWETCAEDRLNKKYPDNFVIKGCLSNTDLVLMGLDPINTFENPQQRAGCHCLSIKQELLTPRLNCSHNCIYCFWKRERE